MVVFEKTQRDSISMNATNLRDKKIEEGLKKRCANCGVEYISPVWGELTELRRMDLRKKCHAAETRKKRSKRSIDEVVKDQAADVNRKKSTREEQARKETPSERERRLGIEACKKRQLRRKEKQKQDESRGAKKTPKVSVTKRKKKLADLLSVDLVRPVLKAQKCDQRTLIKKSSISIVAGTDLLHLSPPKKWTKRQLTDKQKKVLAMFFAHRKPAVVEVEEVEDERKPAAKKEEPPSNTIKWKLTDKQKEMLATLLFDLYFRLSVATVKLKKN